MRAVIDNDWLTMVSRLILGITFIYASFYKIIDPGSFAKSIWYYHMVPGSLINMMALVMPWLEFLCGVGLILGIYFRGSVAWIGVMLMVFLIALVSAISRGLSIDCGCFKAAADATGSAWRSLIFDIVLIPFLVQLLLTRSRRWMIRP
ncbi:DoxX family membrane protein [candidate division GN15 bacterium]|nr:DoxX family membrane protein [candidate division GN15 bacterium]